MNREVQRLWLMSTVEEPIESDQLRQQLAAQAQIIAANEKQLETISANETELAQVKLQLDARQEHICLVDRTPGPAAVETLSTY